MITAAHTSSEQTPWSIYVLLCGDGSLYTGCSNDVAKRFLAHQQGKGGHYTRSHPPVKIVFQQEVGSKSAALKRESEIKKWTRKRKIAELQLKW